MDPFYGSCNSCPDAALATPYSFTFPLLDRGVMEFWHQHKTKILIAVIGPMTAAILGWGSRAIVGLLDEVSELKLELRAAYQTIAQLERELKAQPVKDRSQWERISSAERIAVANESVLELLQLLLVGDRLDVGKLSAAVEIANEMKAAEIEVEEIKNAIRFLQTVQRLIPGGKDPPMTEVGDQKMSDPSEDSPPQIQQVMEPLTKEQLDQYIKTKKGQVKGGKEQE